MTRQDAFDEINRLQDMYIDKLSALIDNPNPSSMKVINFTSATGTGKTKMMAKLINKYPDYYFIITTLSKGQLHLQIRKNLEQDCHQHNFTVYGSADYKINSRLDAEDIIGKIPEGTKCIWLRDEGHIRTNRFYELLVKYCYKIVNFSATNMYNDIQCNFAQTMMLRTVNQTNGTPDDAIKKLLEVKVAHKDVAHYNPCAIFRCVGGDTDLYSRIVNLCNKYNLHYIDITEDEFLMSDLCEDDNEYDVIINKFKIVEGVDIHRAHVLYMDNQPSNNATTIQAIGRCRRNALLYRNDIDILSPENTDLLKHTRECYVYYNVKKMKVATDLDGELHYAFCDHISCEELNAGTSIEVINGQLPNGLYVVELSNATGRFDVVKDDDTGFNLIIPCPSEFYDVEIKHCDDNYIYLFNGKIHIKNIKHFPIKIFGVEPYYDIRRIIYDYKVPYNFQEDVIREFEKYRKMFSEQFIKSNIKGHSFDTLSKLSYNVDFMKTSILNFVNQYRNKKGYKQFCKNIEKLKNRSIKLSAFWYKLGDVCSNTEIILLQYFCIKKKEHGLSNIDLFENQDRELCYIDRYMRSRNTWFSFYHRNNRHLFSVFNDVSIYDISIEKIKEDVDNFINTSIEAGKNKCFCDMLSYISEDIFAWNADKVYLELRESLSRQDLLVLKYCCVEEKKSGLTNKAIKDKLHKLSQLLHDHHLIHDTAFDDIAYNMLSQDCLMIRNSFDVDKFTIKTLGKLNVTPNDISSYFNTIQNKLQEVSESSDIYVDSSIVVTDIFNAVHELYQNLVDGIIYCVKFDYSEFFEDLTEHDKILMHGKYQFSRIPVEIVQSINNYRPYDKVVNDKESAIVGVDLMQQIKSDDDNVLWVESKSVSSKVGTHNKFNSFLSMRYANELSQAKDQLFSGKNNFDLDKKCNSMIGYCVEYYSKYLLYGKSYLECYIRKAQREFDVDILTDRIIIRACMLKYKDNMIRCFGSGAAKIIKGISAAKLIQEQYSYFVSLVVELGTKTAKFAAKALYEFHEIKNDIDDNLSIRHITGLADYITNDTILDIKVRNNIDEKCVRQVLAYHYLSTKRSDLSIKKVIVYDAVSDKAVVIDITSKNMKEVRM